MPSFDPVRFGLIGSGWITRVHARALAAIPAQATIAACADYPRDRSGGRAGRGEALARELGVPRYFADYRAMLEDRSIEAVTVALPNALHAEVTVAALEAGKHVIVEKPLCLTLAEADRIVHLAREKELIAGYAEELCYCPKLERAKAIAASGALGRVFLVKQVEAHAGPYSDWFFDPALAGGGASMDMGCHSIEWARWMFDKAPVVSVNAEMRRFVHKERGPLDDHCLVTFELADGRTAICEAGWTRQGGMVSKAEIQGGEGVLDVDLLTATGLDLFSMRGVEREELYPGWSTPPADWLFENGYPQEMADFARAVRLGGEPRESAEDGRAVLEIIWAAYASAVERRAITLPYTPPRDAPFPAYLYAAGTKR
jgi:predicted dehydrogenase